MENIIKISNALDVPISDLLPDYQLLSNVTIKKAEEPKETEIDTEKFLINYFIQKATDDELLTEIGRRMNK